MREYKKIEKFSVDESCQNECGSPDNPVNIPLPKCIVGCFTTSEEKNALESCSVYCGDLHSPAKVPLPKCTGSCFTTSEEKKML